MVLPTPVLGSTPYPDAAACASGFLTTSACRKNCADRFVLGGVTRSGVLNDCDRCVRVAPVQKSTGFPPEGGGTMQATESRARLAEPAAAAPMTRPALAISRAAAEKALRDGDGPVELTFDVIRVGGATEAMSMILERSDLERTLQLAHGEELALVFDPDELERVIEGSEVEAQGLREKAAVLTVAVAAIAGSAGVASAAAGGARGTGYVVPAGGNVAVVNDAGAVGAGGPGYVTPAGSDKAIVNDAGAVGASGTGYVVPAGGTEAIVNDGASAAPAAGDDATLSSAEAAAIGTGAILLVAGAAFAATRTKRRPDISDVAPA